MSELLSVIVPIYNVSNYLDDCISSIINQTYTNLEIILVNDGSTDNSLDICKKYAKLDSRIIVLDKKNGGLSDARNAGIFASRGTFISLIDSDDTINLNMFELMLGWINATESDIAVCDYAKFHDGEVIKNIDIRECNVVSYSGKKLYITYTQV